jgi:hypothetical protein
MSRRPTNQIADRVKRYVLCIAVRNRTSFDAEQFVTNASITFRVDPILTEASIPAVHFLREAVNAFRYIRSVQPPPNRANSFTSLQ